MESTNSTYYTDEFTQYHHIVLKEERTFGNFIVRSNRLTQAVLAAAHHILYAYYSTHQTALLLANTGSASSSHHWGHLLSLLSFIMALILLGSKFDFPGCPSFTRKLRDVPGLKECLSLVIGILWLNNTTIWFLTSNNPPATASMAAGPMQLLVDMGLETALGNLAFLNWASWTLSFMF